MRQRRDLWVAVTVVVMTAPRPTIPAIPGRPIAGSPPVEGSW
ncbi:hypothetical protein HMPREF9616_00037 [Cutibacterium acnes HL007PA1]|nr:hypothetical protein HMPREF9616_00037 [Cutibacterium acnes HL007PA1]EFT33354.1 hypothetical protein HMPREF9596_01749 [Cutibacterium acnes HL005PA3]